MNEPNFNVVVRCGPSGAKRFFSSEAAAERWVEHQIAEGAPRSFFKILTKGEPMSALQRIMSFQANKSGDLDELVELFAAGKVIQEAYKELAMSPPQAFTDSMSQISKEARERRRDNLERGLKELKARKEALKTLDEKRKDLDSNIAALEQQLAAS